MQAIETTINKTMEEAEEAVREALGEQGFGVLTEIDVSKVLAAKLGVSRNGLKILGACNPGFAHAALEIDPSVALLLPCNVVLEDVGGGSTKVSIADPRALIGGGGGDIEALAEEAAAALGKAARKLET